MSTQIVFLVESAGAAFILWLGLFIITRDLPLRKKARFRWQRPALLAGATTVLLAIYLLGVAMQTPAVTAEEFIHWQKLTWWSTPIAILLFFYAVPL